MTVITPRNTKHASTNSSLPSSRKERSCSGTTHTSAIHSTASHCAPAGDSCSSRKSPRSTGSRARASGSHSRKGHRMHPKTKALAQEWLPPGPIRRARRLLGYVRPPSWEYAPQGWRAGDRPPDGWHAQSVAEVEAEKWHEFVRLTQGNGPLGLSHEAPFP